MGKTGSTKVKVSINTHKHDKKHSKSNKDLHTRPIHLDHDEPAIKAVFDKFSKNKCVDQKKLLAAAKIRFEDQYEFVAPIIKRQFNFFKQSLDEKDYCKRIISHFVCVGLEQQKDFFFGYLDRNKDEKVCETDLFKVMKSLQLNTKITKGEHDHAVDVGQLVVDDLVHVLRVLDEIRRDAGKDTLLKRRHHGDSFRGAVNAQGSVERANR